MPRSSRIACTHFGVRPMPLQVCSGCCGSRYFAGLLRRELLASSEGLYPGLRQGRILGRALRTNPRRIEVEGPHVGALRGIEASLREEREGLVPEAGAPSAQPRRRRARPGLVPATRVSRARSRLRGGVPTSRVGVRSRSTRDSRASNSGCSPRFRELSGARGARATSRAAPLFGTASTRPRRPPDLPRAR